MRAYEINGQQWRVNVIMRDGTGAQTLVKADTEQQAREAAKKYYRGKNLQVRVVSVEPEDSDLTEGVDFTNAVNGVENLIRQRSIKFSSYDELVEFVARCKFLQSQRNDTRFINDVAAAVLRRLHQPK